MTFPSLTGSRYRGNQLRAVVTPLIPAPLWAFAALRVASITNRSHQQEVSPWR